MQAGLQFKWLFLDFGRSQGWKCILPKYHSLLWTSLISDSHSVGEWNSHFCKEKDLKVVKLVFCESVYKEGLAAPENNNSPSLPILQSPFPLLSSNCPFPSPFFTLLSPLPSHSPLSTLHPPLWKVCPKDWTNLLQPQSLTAPFRELRQTLQVNLHVSNHCFKI